MKKREREKEEDEKEKRGKKSFYQRLDFVV